MKTKPIKEEIGQIYKIRDRIDLDPDFQREKVWPLHKQQYFIDTILRDWGIPKFYFYLSSTDRIGKNYQCIDGKQRLNAIFSFFDNEFPLGKNSKELQGKFYKDLPITVRKTLDAYAIHIEEVTADNDREVGELFKRLQLGSPLNSGEKLMAVDSELKNRLKILARHPFLKNKTSLKDKRYTYFTVCAQLCFLEIEGVTDITLTRLESMLKTYRKIDEGGFRLKTRLNKLKSVLDYLNRMFPNQSPYLKNRASIVSLYLLLSELIEKGNLGGKESKLGRFYQSFSKELEKEIEKGVDATDAQYIAYQSAIIEGAYKQKRLKARQDVMLQKLYKFDPAFYKIMNPTPSPEEIFLDLYRKLETKFGSARTVDAWLFSKFKKLKKIQHPRGKVESPATHVRHCLHHKPHGKYKKDDLVKATKFLQKAVLKMLV